MPLKTRPAPDALTIDALAAEAETTTRTIRSFQTRGLLQHPDMRGRTGLYSPAHLERLLSILRLQAQGFTLDSLVVLFTAHERGHSLATVLGLHETEEPLEYEDDAELYGFVELQPGKTSGRTRHPRPLSIVPTTVWNETEAS